MSILTVLPLAVVMVAGTQLVAAVFLASGERPRQASLGFLAGAAIVVFTGTTIAWVVARTVDGTAGGGGGGRREAIRTAIDWVVLALLVALAVVVFLRRHSTGQPAWMNRLRHAGPGYGLRLGLVLFVAMPADDITMATVGATAARRELTWWHLLPFVLLTLLLLALPLLALLLMGRRAERVLPRMRDWAARNSWIVSEVVIAFFILMIGVDLLT
ncbi:MULTISPECIES: GAP family protein [unclassified Micromonospora]|uniref:GAP family protein n=1 Tax=unclassified Micromonospora TaxID=2617518 RepID=UPI002FEFF69B